MIFFGSAEYLLVMFLCMFYGNFLPAVCTYTCLADKKFPYKIARLTELLDSKVKQNIDFVLPLRGPWQLPIECVVYEERGKLLLDNLLDKYLDTSTSNITYSSILSS